ncbi:MAG: phosphotransferase [Rhodocyclaceae bacterium]|nr:phosphotransferase [Rhodocyclaceae bacterium]MCP5239562.1 phosphotransferase [Zoogloeaceae bacterium]MCP5255900.1 phosphotransferase [Zoogloeaceae bacterium]MCW5615078.1 phosphotransferase [Rhodocyclaceae bacterium]
MSATRDNTNGNRRSRRAHLIDAALMDSLGLDALIPPELSDWQTLFVEAMAYFLDRLPAARLSAIIAGQLAFEPQADPAQRLVALLAQCPMLHKLGQVMARNHALDAGLRSRLQTLESMPSSLPAAAISAALGGAFAEDAGVALSDRPLAEGSVAVVLPFSWRAGGHVREGVFKVLKPGIEARLAEELAILPGLASMLERRGRQLGLPALDYRGNLSSVAQLLDNEVRLDREQHNMRCASALLGDHDVVFVPPLLPWCTPRITAMARVRGSSVVDAALPAARKSIVADALITKLLAKPFWSREDEALFHGDLHAGNLLLDEDGRIAVIDWSLAARLAKSQREALLAVAIGGLSFDAQRIREALAALGLREEANPRVQSCIDDALDALADGRQQLGFDWLVGMLDALALQGSSGFGAELAVFRKSWVSLAGVIRDLRGSVRADFPLLAEGLQHFLAEWPARLVAAPDSRDFSTHVSNAELMTLAWSGWSGAGRYWTRLLEHAVTRAKSAERPC